MENVMIVGAGFMGSGIAQVCAQTGYRVYLMDVNEEALNKALAGIRWSLEKFSSKGMLKESPQTVLERITIVRDLSKAADVAWVIEAAFEEQALKEQLLEELDRLVSTDTPFDENF